MVVPHPSQVFATLELESMETKQLLNLTEQERRDWVKEEIYNLPYSTPFKDSVLSIIEDTF